MYPAGNPPSPGETARYRSVDSPDWGSVAKFATVPPLQFVTCWTLSVFHWVKSTRSLRTATPTGMLAAAHTPESATLSRELWKAMVLLSGAQLGLLSVPDVVSW